MSTITIAIAQYIQLMNEKSYEHRMIAYPDLPKLQSFFTTQDGRKYVKVFSGAADGTSRMVHAFIDKRTGDLYKAASRAGPAKDARFNLLTDMDVLRSKADIFGAYLYKISI